MTNIKDIIEKGLNVDFTIKRYIVESVEIGETIEVIYYDRILTVVDTVEFAF